MIGTFHKTEFHRDVAVTASKENEKGGREGRESKEEMRVSEGTVSSNKHLLCALDPV